MKIAILSDSHDNIVNLQKTLDQIKEKAEAIIHCGDLIAPFSAEILSSADLPTYITLGNNDEDHIGMYKKSSDKFTWTHIGQQYGEIEIDSRKLAYTHYPRLGELMARSGEYDAVFYGHTHKSDKRKVGDTLLLNPGAICGIQNGKMGTATYGIYDTIDNFATIIEII